MKLNLNQLSQVRGGDRSYSIKLHIPTGRFCIFFADSEKPFDCFRSFEMALSFGEFVVFKMNQIQRYQERFKCSFEAAVDAVVYQIKQGWDF